MEWIINLGFADVYINLKQIGEDILITVTGGAEHIGCAVLSVPRPSLSDPDQMSCTSSVLNVSGHKDDFICRILAEKAVKKYESTVVCTGGFHLDHIAPEQIKILIRAIEKFDFS